MIFNPSLLYYSDCLLLFELPYNFEIISHSFLYSKRIIHNLISTFGHAATAIVHLDHGTCVFNEFDLFMKE